MRKLKTENTAINKKLLIWALFIGLAGTLLVTSWQTAALRREKEELQKRLDREIQEGIAGEIFRLHVVANSDSKEDQELKMEVKKTVVDCLEENLGEEADLEETRRWGGLSCFSQCGEYLFSGQNIRRLYLSRRRV